MLTGMSWIVDARMQIQVFDAEHCAADLTRHGRDVTAGRLRGAAIGGAAWQLLCSQ